MVQINENDKKLIEVLKEASKPINFFTLRLEYNNKTIAKKDFSAEKYSSESIENTRLHFLIVDFVRTIQEELRKNDIKPK